MILPTRSTDHPRKIIDRVADYPLCPSMPPLLSLDQGAYALVTAAQASAQGLLRAAGEQVVSSLLSSSDLRRNAVSSAEQVPEQCGYGAVCPPHTRGPVTPSDVRVEP